MTNATRTTLHVLALLVPGTLIGQQHPIGDPHAPHASADAAHDALAQFVFPPELVMQHQAAIGLEPAQRTAITGAVRSFQDKTLELQWQVQAETQRLHELLASPRVDQAAALAQVDKLLAVEREVKRAHMALLIQIKNELTPAQQEQLAAARRHRADTR